MHAPSLTPVLTAGLVATSAVSCFQLDTGCGLVVRHVVCKHHYFGASRDQLTDWLYRLR